MENEKSNNNNEIEINDSIGCMNINNGCKYRGNNIQILKHLLNCSFFNCKNCNWIGTSQDLNSEHITNCRDTLENEYKDEVVNMFYNGEDCYVWDKEGVEILRFKFKILGQLIGTVPSFKSQNKMFTLPMYFEKEQVTLLLKKGWIRVVNLKSKKNNLNCEEIIMNERITEEEDDHNEEKYTKTNKRKNIDHKFFQIPLKIENISRFNEIKYDDWIRNYYPKDNNKDLMKTIIYEDLYNRGYYITTGNKFSGDYLLYPNDPLTVHAHFILIIQDFDLSLPCLSIASHTRIGVSVKKSIVYASVRSPINLDTSFPDYITLDFAGVT
eukprot:TRINITY_DN7368_c0_g1_i1.p1 TRINITY_DN7368_c0_g1~~TRINITY_DN7368_c0_g1_i1.p1  ORF type:complete len:325 (+),score=70.93 TRINITY_DN7368_c0_g1_i1:85-1059(+)